MMQSFNFWPTVQSINEHFMNSVLTSGVSKMKCNGVFCNTHYTVIFSPQTADNVIKIT